MEKGGGPVEREAREPERKRFAIFYFFISMLRIQDKTEICP